MSKKNTHGNKDGDAAKSLAISYDPKSALRHNRAASVVYPIAKGLTRPMGTMKVYGGENLTKEGPLIVAAYHQSNLDPLIVGMSMYKLGRLPRFMAKHTLFSFPLGVVMKSLGQIPVIRGTRSASDSLAFAKAALKAGQTVTVYPEGTHTKDPDLWPGRSKTGAARLALETGTPIVTVAHWGVQEALPGKSLKPSIKPSRVMTVDFAEPIITAGVEPTPKNIASLTDHITARIALQLAHLRGEELPERYKAALEWRKA